MAQISHSFFVVYSFNVPFFEAEYMMEYGVFVKRNERVEITSESRYGGIRCNKHAEKHAARQKSPDTERKG